MFYKMKQLMLLMVIYGLCDSVSVPPYVVHLRILRDTGELIHCGGTILNEDWILTAATCFLNVPVTIDVQFSGSIATFSFESIRIEVDYIRNQIPFVIIPEFHYELNVKKQIEMPLNNLALLKLTEPLNFSKTIQKVRRAPEYWPYDEVLEPMDVECDFYTFGMNTEKNIIVGNNIQFTTRYSKSCCMHYSNMNRTVCSLTNQETTACHGDYGGPLICYDMLYGILSYFAVCAIDGDVRCGAEGTVHWFTYTPKYWYWIDSQILKPIYSQNIYQEKNCTKKLIAANLLIILSLFYNFFCT